MSLWVPHVQPDTEMMAAAFAYVNAGWYVLPVKHGSKHPGSVVGFSWNDKSSRDVEVIASWFAGTDHGIALHAGRSGAVIFDVDKPAAIPLILSAAFADELPPMQLTREGDERRGHYLFLQPPDRSLGNGTGRLGGDWGEVRGLNGVIIVAPSVHEDVVNGGSYRWLQTGTLPVLPDSVADLLHDASPSEDAATDADIEAFLDEHTGDEKPDLLDGWVATYRRAVAKGESRHDKAVSMLAGALHEAAIGCFPARAMVDAFRNTFVEAVAKPPTGKQGGERTGKTALSEWAGILAWAVGQAKAADPTATLARLADVRPIEQGKPAITLGLGTPVGPASNAVPNPAADSPAIDEGPRSSWTPIDLSPYLDGTYVPEEPTLLPRTDDAHLLYAGRVHSFHGESESGKSMVAQAEAARLVSSGHDVLYLDYEADAPAVTARLLELGAPANLILRHMTYIRPETSPYGPADHPRWEELIARRFTLAVIDGVTDALGTHRASSKDNDEISGWMREVPRVLASKTGAAVVLVDHVVKDAENRGRYALGGQAKMNALDGAAYTVEVAEHLGRGLKGVVVLRVAKDRPGSVRPIAGAYRKGDRTQEAARITIDSTTPNRIIVTVEPAKETAKVDPNAPDPLVTDAMYLTSQWIRDRPDGVKKDVTVTGVRGRDINVRKALALLEDGGYITHDGTLYRHVKTFLGWPTITMSQQPSRPSETVPQPSGTGEQGQAKPSGTVRPYEVGRPADGSSQLHVVPDLEDDEQTEAVPAITPMSDERRRDQGAFVIEAIGRGLRVEVVPSGDVIDKATGEVLWSP